MTNEESKPKRPTEASVLARLEGLRSDRRRPQTALLAENLESVEKSLARGIPRVAIWEALCEEGFTMTFKSFETFLHRLRKRKLAASSPKAKAVAPLQATASKPSVSPAPKENPSQTQTAPQTPNQPESLTAQEEKELREYEEFKKSVAHLPIIQRSRKLADFLEKQVEARPSYTTRKWLEKDSKPAETSPTPETPTKPPFNIPGYKSKLTDKDREEYQALKEAIKDLPDREKRKRMEQFWSQR